MSHPKLFDLRSTSGRIDARWRGRWEEPDAEAYVQALEAAYRAGPVEALVVDATQLEHCSILARGRLADAQERLKTHQTRCVYLADSPQIRGLCLWIVRVAEDANARVVARKDEVDAWLESREGRLERAKRRADLAFSKLKGLA